MRETFNSLKEKFNEVSTEEQKACCWSFLYAVSPSLFFSSLLIQPTETEPSTNSSPRPGKSKTE
jgi:hypothetical protein